MLLCFSIAFEYILSQIRETSKLVPHCVWRYLETLGDTGMQKKLSKTFVEMHNEQLIVGQRDYFQILK